MTSTKAFCVMAAITVAAFAESMNINRSDSVEHNVDRNNELKVRNRRFLFNLFPGAFNDENYQVQTLQQQQRVLSRVQPVNSLFSHQSLNFYLQALLQQRMVRQRYFDLTGERVSYYNDVNYNN